MKRKFKQGIVFTLAILLSITVTSVYRINASVPSNSYSKNIYQAYSKLILKDKNEYGYYPYFGCQDINGDKIPELFIFRDYYKNSIGGYDIYTYKNGKAQYLSKITGGSRIMYTSKMVICRNADGITVYKWRGNKLVKDKRYVYSVKNPKKFANASYKYVGKVINTYSSKNRIKQSDYLKKRLMKY